jgi:hypothetical protein
VAQGVGPKFKPQYHKKKKSDFTPHIFCHNKNNVKMKGITPAVCAEQMLERQE